MSDGLELDRQVCFALYAASRATTAAYRQILQELGLTYPQYLVLLALWERDGRGVTDLSDALALDSGTLSPLLKRLEALGLVERRRLSTDERRVEIHLTAEGADKRALAVGIPQRLARTTNMTEADLIELRDSLVAYTNSISSYPPQEEGVQQ